MGAVLIIYILNIFGAEYMQMLKIRSSQDLNLGVLCQMFLLSHWSSGNGAEDSMSR